MNNLKNLLKIQLNLQSIPKYIIYIIIACAIIGFSDATFLTVKHFQNVIPPCTTDGCETVLNSEYSEILGVPVALLGAIYYFAILLLMFIHLDTKQEKYLRYVMMMSVLGFLFALWFTFLQLFIIKAICPYCVLSATMSTIIFIVSMYSLKKYRLILN